MSRRNGNKNVAADCMGRERLVRTDLWGATSAATVCASPEGPFASGATVQRFLFGAKRAELVTLQRVFGQIQSLPVRERGGQTNQAFSVARRSAWATEGALVTGRSWRTSVGPLRGARKR